MEFLLLNYTLGNVIIQIRKLEMFIFKLLPPSQLVLKPKHSVAVTPTIMKAKTSIVTSNQLDLKKSPTYSTSCAKVYTSSQTTISRICCNFLRPAILLKNKVLILPSEKSMQCTYSADCCKTPGQLPSLVKMVPVRPQPDTSGHMSVCR